MKKISVLGTEYTINKSDVVKDKELNGLDGYCDFENQNIVINSSIDDSEQNKKTATRHEIVHAFLFESGLDSSSWGRNEEIVDWIAIQFPKMMKAFEEADCL